MFASDISLLDVDNVVEAVLFLILVKSYDVLVGGMQLVVFEDTFNPEELLDL